MYCCFIFARFIFVFYRVFAFIFLLLNLTHLDGDLSERFQDLAETTTRPWTTTLEGHVLTNPSFGNDQLVNVQVVVVFSIGNRGLKAFLHALSHALVRESQVDQ